MIELIRTLFGSEHQSSPLLTDANQQFLSMLDRAQSYSALSNRIFDNQFSRFAHSGA